MPGKFYVENKAEKVSLQAIEYALTDIGDKFDAIKIQTDKLAGETPGEGSAIADWQLAETNVVSIGTTGTRNKIHDLTLSIHNLIGSQITVRLYKMVNGTERKIYEQNFNATTDPPGLPIINGSWAIHGILRATLQSNDAADNSKVVDYDFMLEAM
ncbi:hypothetical protein B1778_00760 [Dehalococcoides mccartyi]|uniref:hypothetical protein n=1 Tax=Dehalococcoides mccartyi TaxID=61435 RepID=UPI00098F3C6E|nr:hypothetical protein [Dehalococcoides mccartyi]AQU05303.1 hypothetical protein B1777_00905 [Dehalococcoides mccartyi]AQU06756.1 hypothetical protein B1778_00760 [Dehalococcoides mccartyi]